MQSTPANDDDKDGLKLCTAASDISDILRVSDEKGRACEALFHCFCMDHRVIRMEMDCMVDC